MRFVLIAGQRHDATQALAPIDSLPAAHVLADRARDIRIILDAVEASGVGPIGPAKTCSRCSRGFDATIYKHRNRSGRTIGGLK